MSKKKIKKTSSPVNETGNRFEESTAGPRKLTPLSFIKSLASLKLTVICLVLLSIIVVWGTVYQADHGLYQAQQKFFQSWFFLLFGFIPFPGTVLIMFVLFINLLFSLIFRIGFRWSNLGNIVLHIGLIILFVGGGLTFFYSEESSIMLKEGESTRFSNSRTVWELAAWEIKGGDTGNPGGNEIYAADTHVLKTGSPVVLNDLDIRLDVKEFFTNCTAYTGGDSSVGTILNASGIQYIKSKPEAVEVEENIPGGVFLVGPAGAASNDAGRQTLLLYGEDAHPTPVKLNNRQYFFSLRKQKIPLPLHMALLDFKVKMYPNSSIPKSYESKVSIKDEEKEGIEREVVISMNKPLRFKEYTFFQSSYFIAQDGTEYTILAVVKNVGRLVPYISSITIFIGMLIHFLMMLFKRRKRAMETNNE